LVDVGFSDPAFPEGLDEECLGLRGEIRERIVNDGEEDVAVLHVGVPFCLGFQVNPEASCFNELSFT